MVFFDGDKKMKKGMMKMNKINKIKICIIIGLFILVESICVFNMGDATSKHDVSVKELTQKIYKEYLHQKKHKRRRWMIITTVNMKEMKTLCVQILSLM